MILSIEDIAMPQEKQQKTIDYCINKDNVLIYCSE